MMPRKRPFTDSNCSGDEIMELSTIMQEKKTEEGRLGEIIVSNENSSTPQRVRLMRMYDDRGFVDPDWDSVRIETLTVGTS